MFCSKCGKTLAGSTDRCPHCGEPIGESRFEGNGYTAAQPRFLSGDVIHTDQPATPYTRTTYTSMGDEPGDDAGGDIYSKTTYRPVLKDAPPPAEAELKAAAEENDAKKAFEALSKTATVAPARAERKSEPDSRSAVQAAEDDPETRPVGPYAAVVKPVEIPVGEESDVSVIITPVKPIKKTGISPEVEQYIRRMNEQKGRVNKKAAKSSVAAVADIVPTGDEVFDKLAVEAAQAREQAEEGDQTPSRRKRAQKRKLPGWVRAASVIVCIALILGGALYMLMRNVDIGGSQLEGVSYDLHRDGIALIRSHTLEGYRRPLASALAADPIKGPEQLVKAQEDAKAEIAALMPETPLENDKLFINVIYNLQKMADSAIMQDALALANAADPTLAANLKDEASQAWTRIEELIARLETAKEKPQMQGIFDDTKEGTATPAPNATPEPPEYSTLTPGMLDNKKVKQMQQRLSELKWFNSKIDGDFGPVTITAVKKFQEAVGLEGTGIADSAMQEMLYSTDAPKFGKKGVTAAPTGAPTLSSGGGNQIVDPAGDAGANDAGANEPAGD